MKLSATLYGRGFDTRHLHSMVCGKHRLGFCRAHGGEMVSTYEEGIAEEPRNTTGKVVSMESYAAKAAA